MLSVSADHFIIPMQWELVNGMATWVLYHQRGNDMTVSAEFNYTFEVSYWDDDGEFTIDRMTYRYSGKSVKPTGRTLRKFGSELTSQIVSVLSSIKDPKGSQRETLSLEEFDRIHNILENFGYGLADGFHELKQ